jgi:hypothetical protein
VLLKLSQDWAGVEEGLALEHGSSTPGTVNSMLVNEGGNRILDWLNGGEPVAKPIFSEMEIAFARQFEYQIFPREELSREGLELYLQTAIDHARARGARQVSIEDLTRTREIFSPSLP